MQFMRTVLFSKIWACNNDKTTRSLVNKKNYVKCNHYRKRNYMKGNQNIGNLIIWNVTYSKRNYTKCTYMKRNYMKSIIWTVTEPVLMANSFYIGTYFIFIWGTIYKLLAVVGLVAIDNVQAYPRCLWHYWDMFK